ncbi:MAG: hypothetical protein NUV57_00195 [archaeon]|nr:hypothetical protein [archaeon]
MGALREILETIKKLLHAENAEKIRGLEIKKILSPSIYKYEKSKEVVKQEESKEVVKQEEPKESIKSENLKQKPLELLVKPEISKKYLNPPKIVKQKKPEFIKSAFELNKKTKKNELIKESTESKETQKIKKPKRARKPRRTKKPLFPKNQEPKKPVKTTIYVKELEGYRKIIRDLRKEVENLKKQVEQQSIGPTQALSGVRVIYDELKGTNVDIDSEIKKTKSLMDYLERDFLQRKITEDLFKEKMFGYREKLHMLSLEKKELASQKKDLTITTKKIPQVVPVSLEQLSKTDNLEKLLIKQQETLEKIAEQRPVIVEAISQAMPKTSVAPLAKPVVKPVLKSAVKPITNVPIKTSVSEVKSKPVPPIPVSKKPVLPITPLPKPVPSKPVPSKPVPEKSSPVLSQSVIPEKKILPTGIESAVVKSVAPEKAKAPESKTINSFLEEKAKGKIDEQKLEELEGKVSSLMKQYHISEGEIEKKLGNTETGNLVASVNKLVSILELEKKTNQTLQPEKIETAMRFTTPLKMKEEVKGIVTEIRKQRIVTDFDKVLNYIYKNEEAKMGKIAKELNIPRQRIEECCNLLEKEKQVLLFYSPIGDVVVMTPDYKEKKDIANLNKKKKR